MIRFNNDYNRGALPEVLAALENTNDNSFAGYGEDEWCERACGLIRRLCGCPDADIRFFPGATQANFVIISAALSPVQSVISADTGHINCHEAASVESSGHKILSLPGKDGKITAEQIEALFSREDVTVEKKGKKGVVEQNIIPMIRKFSATPVSGNVLKLEARVCCQNPSLNPMLLGAAVNQYLPDLAPDFIRYSRVEIYDTNETIFR